MTQAYSVLTYALPIPWVDIWLQIMKTWDLLSTWLETVAFEHEYIEIFGKPEVYSDFL